MNILTSIMEIYKPVLAKEILGPILTILIAFVIYNLLKKINKKIFVTKNKKIDQRKSKTLETLLNNIYKYLLIIFSIISILNIYGVKTGAFLTSLGIVSVVVGLALQDILKDILSGISIIIENQYAVGDYITIGDFQGEVIALGLRTTKIKSYTGDIKIITNRNINEVINHSLAKSLAIVNFCVSYEENTEKVENIINKLCLRLTKELKNIKSEVKLLGVVNLGVTGVEYRISAETKPMMHYEVERQILREVKVELEKNKILLPYNQVVIHNA